MMKSLSVNKPAIKGDKTIHSLLKWPGGKAWLAGRLSKIFETELTPSGVYFEPFFGGGAIFFHLQPQQAVLSDINLELIDFYKYVRDHDNAVIRRVWSYSNTRECYYRVRKMRPRTQIGQAARFLFLNRTCWGGVFRLNQDGVFNVPFGNSGRTICHRENVMQAAKALKRACLEVDDFQHIIAKARCGDCVYVDPPYTTLGQGNGFLRYNEKLFKWADQRRLAISCLEAAERGAFIAVSGLWHEELLKLFPVWWAWKVERQSLISRTIEGRHSIYEVVLFSRKPKYIFENLTQI